MVVWWWCGGGELGGVGEVVVGGGGSGDAGDDDDASSTSQTWPCESLEHRNQTYFLNKAFTMAKVVACLARRGLGRAAATAALRSCAPDGTDPHWRSHKPEFKQCNVTFFEMCLQVNAHLFIVHTDTSS